MFKFDAALAMPLVEPLHDRSLRIIHCVRAPIGGIFRNVLDLALEQSVRGHRVGIILDSGTGGEFEARKIAEIKPLLALGVTRLPMKRSVRPSDLLALARVYTIIRDLRPDVVHGHGAKGGVLARIVGTLLSRRAHPVGRFYTPHGGSLHYSPKSIGGRLIFTIERCLEQLCDGIIHVSRYEALAYFSKVGQPHCPTTVIVNGLRPEEFDLIEPRQDASDFLYMGMLRALKGPDVLINAVAMIRARTGKAPTLTIVGDGPDRDIYRALVARLGLEDAITFRDPRPTREGFTMGRCLVVPSRAESMPYIVLEGTAAGMPLIATKVGGIPEIITGAAAERLVPPGDPTALADAMLAVLDEPINAKAKALKARTTMRRRFTVAAMTDKVEHLYSNALARRLGLPAEDIAMSLQPAE